MSLINMNRMRQNPVSSSLILNDPFFRSVLDDPFYRGVSGSSLTDPLSGALSLGNRGRWNAAYLPAMDMIELPDHYLVKADVPGFSREQIELECEGSTLCIKGNWKCEDCGEKQQQQQQQHQQHQQQQQQHLDYLARERPECSFQRTVNFGMNVDSGKISACMKDGVLSVKVPKNQTQGKKIPVKSA